jgi:predicted acyl esterase
MKKVKLFLIMGLLFSFTCAYSQTTQPDAAQPQQHQNQTQEQEEQLQQGAPEQSPDQMEQDYERVPEPGEENIEDATQEPNNYESSVNNEFIDRFENVEPLKEKNIPEMVMNGFQNGYFNDWEIVEIYNADDLNQIEVPADYVFRVQKNDVRMNLYYQSNGELLMQEKGSLSERI